MDDEFLAEFVVEYESADVGHNYVSAHMPIYGKDDRGDRERFEFNCDFLPSKIKAPVTNSHATIAFRREAKDEPVKLDDTVLRGEFGARIIGIEVSTPCFKLTTIGDRTEVARLFIHPDHLPPWLGAEGDTCFIGFRLEYDHERTLDSSRIESVSEAENTYRGRRTEEAERIRNFEDEYLD